MNSIPEDLRRRIEDYGATVVDAREIAHGTQYRLARGTEKATLNVYHTDKVLEGGKASGLRNMLRDWRISRVANPGSAKAVTGL